MDKNSKHIEYLNDHEIRETTFSTFNLNKFESIMAQGNGYLGVRAATEEGYIGETRNFFVLGTFNKFSAKEVTELPNFPDILNLSIIINGNTIDLNSGNCKYYERKFNYYTGELIRSFLWENNHRDKIKISFKRFVSMDKLHCIFQEVIIEPVTSNLQIKVISGIDGSKTNSGAQHFDFLEKKIKKSVLQMKIATTQSNIDAVISTKIDIQKNNNKIKPCNVISKRRELYNEFEFNSKSGDEIVIHKTSSIFTTRDFDFHKDEDLLNKGYCEVENNVKYYYTEFKKSCERWGEIFTQAILEITSKDFKDQLLVNFARYHLHIMTSKNNSMVNIGAKGLTGEGYKGHTFWDTDIFILPYFTYCYPDIAQHLVEYRFLSLTGAREKASLNKYNGAQIPWESAWLTDGETTPYYGEVNYKTGASSKILTGLIEDHISADVSFGFNQFIMITGKNTYIKEYNQLILETAYFWLSRATRNKYGQFEILNVIGPDEYNENISNNAYTNYLAKFNVSLAIKVLKSISDKEYSKIYKYIDNQSKDIFQKKLLNFEKKIKISRVNINGIIPQDDSYLDKPEIDIRKYKQANYVNGIFDDYSPEEVDKYQVSKQADVVLLLCLFNENFSREVMESNYRYYETRCLHDSSLSLSTYSWLASSLGDVSEAYILFEKMFNVDLGSNMCSSNDGIHAAAMGGIWEAVVCGFGGLKFKPENGEISISPNIPKQWEKLKYSVKIKSNIICVEVTHNEIMVNLDSAGNDSTVDTLSIIKTGNRFIIKDL